MVFVKIENNIKAEFGVQVLNISKFQKSNNLIYRLLTVNEARLYSIFVGKVRKKKSSDSGLLWKLYFRGILVCMSALSKFSLLSKAGRHNDPIAVTKYFLSTPVHPWFKSYLRVNKLNIKEKNYE